jgi:hypothetical protein
MIERLQFFIVVAMSSLLRMSVQFSFKVKSKTSLGLFMSSIFIIGEVKSSEENIKWFVDSILSDLHRDFSVFKLNWYISRQHHFSIHSGDKEHFGFRIINSNLKVKCSLS